MYPKNTYSSKCPSLLNEIKCESLRLYKSELPAKIDKAAINVKRTKPGVKALFSAQ